MTTSLISHPPVASSPYPAHLFGAIPGFPGTGPGIAPGIDPGPIPSPNPDPDPVLPGPDPDPALPSGPMPGSEPGNF
jgi:hypothetical protein